MNTEAGEEDQTRRKRGRAYDRARPATVPGSLQHFSFTTILLTSFSSSCPGRRPFSFLSFTLRSLRLFCALLAPYFYLPLLPAPVQRCQ